MDQLKQNFGKFLFPVFLILMGLTAIILTITLDQNGKFLFAGLAILMVGVISLLFSLGVINRKTQLTLSTVMIIGALSLVYYNFASVKSDIDFANNKKSIYSKVIQSLKDVRTAQLTHHKLFGTYVNDFDSLETFVRTAKLPIIKAIGSVPDSLTEEQALDMGIIVRDTILVPVLDHVFLSEEAIKDRLFDFKLDSLRYAPVSGSEFFVASGIIESGGLKVPVFLAKDMNPFDPSDTLKVGSLKEASTSGNWSGE